MLWDFYCKKLNFVIEIDGCTHNIKQESDLARQKSIEALGIKFIRFDDERVKYDMLNVLRELEEFIEKLEMKKSK